MNIGLIDADLIDKGTRHPNLAIMKIAGYHISKGDYVELIFKDYGEILNFDLVYISKVFTFTKVPDWVLIHPNVIYGGTGFFLENAPNLPEEIEHHKPYYDIYKRYIENEISKGKDRSKFNDYLNYSIGFTTRGCFRKCSFCVNKKYDRVLAHSPVNEFIDDDRPYIYLWDDNILAYPKYKEIFDDLKRTNKPFQFRQGLDLRLMTDEKALILSTSKYHGDIIFAFDHISDREIIENNIQIWKRYSSKICKLYVLCAYDSQDITDVINTFERIKILMKYGCLPYIMRHENYMKSEFKDMYIQLARWCNQPQFFKKMSFREFCVANQNYVSSEGKISKSLQTLVLFEDNYNEIAKEYFDLKYENENLYVNQYGFGKITANKPSCTYCTKNYVPWESLNKEEEFDFKIIVDYFMFKSNLLCTCYKNSFCRNTELYSKKMVEKINEIEINVLIEEFKRMNIIIDQNDKVLNYFKLEDVLSVIKLFEEYEYTFEELYQHFSKYSQSKFKKLIEYLSIIDILVYLPSKKSRKIELTPLAKALRQFDNVTLINVIKKMSLRKHIHIALSHTYFSNVREDKNEI